MFCVCHSVCLFSLREGEGQEWVGTRTASLSIVGSLGAVLESIGTLYNVFILCFTTQNVQRCKE